MNNLQTFSPCPAPRKCTLSLPLRILIKVLIAPDILLHLGNFPFLLVGGTSYAPGESVLARRHCPSLLLAVSLNLAVWTL